MTGVDILLIATTIASTAMTAMQSISQGNAAAAQAQTQSMLFERQAQQAQLLASARASEFKRTNKGTLAKQRALLGAAGVEPSGSPLLVASNTARELAFQTEKIKNQGDVEANRLRTLAGFEQTRAGNARSKAAFGAGSSLLKGANSLAGMKFGK
ncbi:MAG: hypothetical protein O2912_06635 [Proteobacteria bacterium]|nr:hypothetical protein [Pseudomonadota bacterium]